MCSRPLPLCLALSTFDDASPVHRRIRSEETNMPSVYIETSIVSYLTARPSQNLMVAAWQGITAEWWDRHRLDYQLCTSGLTLEEAGRGDPEAAIRRMARLEGIPLLAMTDRAIELAGRLLHPGPLPLQAAEDALHIALSAVHAVDFLLTWNFRHIDNAQTKPHVRELCVQNGYHCAEICTPQELTGGALYEG